MSGDDRAIAMMEQHVGKRFATCEFRNFDTGTDKHRQARQRLKDTVQQYAKELRENVDAGRNLIICGAMGSGKDHLACSVIRVAIHAGISVRYVRGSSLCSQMVAHNLEFRTPVIPSFAECELLVISDLEPQKDGASDFEERAILELIDRRYASLRPTIVTSNATSRKDLERKVGARTIDRLVHGSVVVVTSWESYRKAGKP